MAITIIEEDGTGKSNANSYLTVAQADDYFDARGIQSWGGGDAIKKESLVNATIAIDSLFYDRFLSHREVSSDQALQFPRLTFWSRDFRRYDSNDIPQPVKDATAEIALKYLQGEDIFPEGRADNNILSESLKLDGALTKSKTYAKTPDNQAMFEDWRKIELILDPVLKRSRKRIVMGF